VSTYAEGVARITLTGSDPAPAGGGDASGVSYIEYSLNGAEPESNDASTVVIVCTDAGSNTLEYFVYDKAGNEAGPYSVDFTITRPESTPPQSSISVLPSGWVRTNVDYTISAVDTATPTGITSYSGLDYFGLFYVDFESPAPTGTITGEGLRTVFYYSVDKWGNRETYPVRYDAEDNAYDTKTATVKIDKTRPAVWSDVTNKTFAGSVAPKLSALDSLSGVAQIAYRLDGAVTTTTVNAATATLPSVTATGTHTLVYTATDLAGNVSGLKTATFSVTGGLTRTSITIKTNATTTYIGKTPILSGAVTPNEMAGKVIVVYVKKPLKTFWTYSSNRVAYSLLGGTAWQYKYYFKPGMVKGTYTFKAAVPSYPGYATSESPTTVSIRLR